MNASRPARSADARRSDATLRRAARALEAERAPLPRAMPAETRKAFEGLSDAAPVSETRPTFSERLARHPYVQHANARKLTALGPVTPSDMDPGERDQSLMGRLCAPFGEV